MNRKGDDRIIEHAQIVEAGLMPDDVIGVSGTFSQNGDMFYVDDLHFPMQSSHDKKFAEQGVSVAFLSDIHVGSKTFLEAQWHKMVQWFNTDPLARTIKYLILSGDCVDGVGIYPGQDKELANQGFVWAIYPICRVIGTSSRLGRVYHASRKSRCCQTC